MQNIHSLIDSYFPFLSYIVSFCALRKQNIPKHNTQTEHNMHTDKTTTNTQKHNKTTSKYRYSQGAEQDSLKTGFDVVF